MHYEGGGRGHVKEFGSHWMLIKTRKQILSSELPKGTSPAYTLAFAHQKDD